MRECNQFTKAFGRHLKTLRTSAHLSQSELAERVECNQKYISKLELGIKVPSFWMLIKLVKVLKSSPSELMEFEYQLKSSD